MSARVTIDLSVLPGESATDHLRRIGDEVRKPKTLPKRTLTPVGLATVAQPSKEDIARAEALAAEAFARLRKKGKRR